MRAHPSVGMALLLPHLKTHPRKPEKIQRLSGERREEEEARERGKCGRMAGGKETREGRGGGALRMGD